MRQRTVLRSVLLVPAICITLGLGLACGSGGSSKNSPNSKSLSQPQNAPTATVPPSLPSPIAASSVVGGTTSNGPAPDTYVVKAGDTLGAIAAQLGVSVSDLATANGITDPARIQVGQQLKVPRPGQTPAPSASPAAGGTPPLSPIGAAPTSASGSVAIPPTGGAPSGGGTPRAGPSAAALTPAGGTPGAPGAAGEYTVRSGDTACKIARANDISVAELAQANNMTTDQIARLSINQLLKIPPATGHRDC
ncbi:MAG TPA: LysM peptidoglycan-binding domain-containing protein [Dehalococcoidia bacterium]|nr:LysM peptidoglycan-binding domain-containing protein [Dehalococcoidia bacterium]